MKATTNTELRYYDNLRQSKIRFSLILDQILSFTSYPNMVREVQNLSRNIKEIAWKCFTLMNILI